MVRHCRPLATLTKFFLTIINHKYNKLNYLIQIENNIYIEKYLKIKTTFKYNFKIKYSICYLIYQYVINCSKIK